MSNTTCGFFREITAIRGGNSRNGVNCGLFYVNANNTASNASWNNGAALFSYVVYNLIVYFSM